MSVGKGRPDRLISPPGGGERSERWGILIPGFERQHREACKPVRADEITAGEPLAAGGEVALRGVTRDVDSWIARGQCCGNSVKAPCAREVETVEMHELRIGTIDDLDGHEQRGRRAIDEARQ